MRNAVLGRVAVGYRPIKYGIVTIFVCLFGCRCDCWLWGPTIRPGVNLDIPIIPSVDDDEPEGHVQEAYSRYCPPNVPYDKFESSFELHALNWTFFNLVLAKRSEYEQRLLSLREQGLPDAWAAMPWVLPERPFPPTTAPSGNAAYTVPAVHAVASCFYATYPNGSSVFTEPMPPNCDLLDLPTPEEIREVAAERRSRLQE